VTERTPRETRARRSASATAVFAYGARVAPRIAPGTRRDIGVVNFALTRAIGAAIGGRPPNLFTTLGRHRGLFRRWLLFAGGLMPGGKLPRTDTELVILRVAHNTACEYELRHHERLARLAGLAPEEVERVRLGPGAEGWLPRQALLLRAADELHGEGRLSDSLWDELRPLLSDAELIELCLLVGHYEMLAMTLNSLRVEPDPGPIGASRLARLLR
jgi:AhpD family alkylhydroperoxidase